MVELVLILGGLNLLAALLVAWPLLRGPARGVSGRPPEEPAAPLREEVEARNHSRAKLNEDLSPGKCSLDEHTRAKATLEHDPARLLARSQLPEPPVAPGVRQPARVSQGRDSGAAEPWPFPGPALVGCAAGGLLLLGAGLGLLLPRLIRFDVAPAGVSLAGGAAERAGELEQALAREPQDVRRLLALGHVALDQRLDEPAVRGYRRVLAVEPNNVEAITHVGILLFRRGHTDQALEHLDRALTLDPTYAHALWYKAQVLYLAKQDYLGAIRVWEAFLAVMPSGVHADRARVMILEAKERVGHPGGTPGTPGRGSGTAGQ